MSDQWKETVGEGDPLSRIPPADRALVEAFAERHGVSSEAAARYLVERGVEDLAEEEKLRN
jgi:hypothetical protein